MPTVQQTDKPTQPDEAINFLVPADFKLAVDLEIKRQRSTLRDFGTRAFAAALGIPAPGEATAALTASKESKPSRAAKNKETIDDIDKRKSA